MNWNFATFAFLAVATIATAAYVLFIARRIPLPGGRAVQYGMLAVVVAGLAVASLSLFRTADYSPEPSLGAPSPREAPAPPVPARYIAEVFLLAPDDPLRQVYDSFGMIILSRRDGTKSRAVCSAMLNYYYRGAYAASRSLDDLIYRVKPVYWPIISRKPNYDADCNYLLDYYDLARAKAIGDRLGLRTDGPFLVTARFGSRERADIASLLIYDLSAVPNDELSATFKAYLDAYIANRRQPQQIAATRRQQIKSIVLAFSEPIAYLFGIEPATP